MGKFFNPDSPLMSFLGRLGDLIILNVLWLVCSLPVVTLGASLTAMNVVAQELAADACTSVVSGFFKAFRRDWKQGTVLGLIFLVLFGISYLEISVLLSGSFPVILTALCMIPPILILSAASYAFPLLAHYDNTIGNILKNSLLLSIGNLPRSLVICAVNLIPALLAYFFPYLFVYTLAVWFFLGFAVLCYLNSQILKPLFLRLEQQQAPEGDE